MSNYLFQHTPKCLCVLLFLSLSIGSESAFSQYAATHLKSAPFSVAESYLAKHDIVFKSPTDLEAEGFPLGNGDLGGMIWNHDYGVELQINKNDLWTAPVEEEDGKSILKHAARVKIDFGIPVYNWIHLKSFTGRLSLAKGQVNYEAESPFANSRVESWIVQGKNVWVITFDNRLNKTVMPGDVTSTITLERIGSRAFAGWYGGAFPKDPAASMGQAAVKVSGRDMVLVEKSDGLDFAVVCRVLEPGSTLSVMNARRGELRTDATKTTLLISVVTGKESETPEQAAIALLDEVEEQTLAKAKQEKDDWYQRFWSNSFVKIGHDYLENIYYMRRYLMAAGSQGQYPIAFNGGLWRWNRDVLNWVTPHHWNTQQQYWGIAAQNDTYLMRPYLDTYFKMIPYAQQAAKRKGATSDAIWITEAHDFDGRQVSASWGPMAQNLSPAAQVAALFWDYYAFTGDKRFLRDTAYVFMEKALNFYLDKLEWDEQAETYFLHSTLYESESVGVIKNSESDRNALEALLRNCITAAGLLGKDKDKVKKWRFVLDHLWERKFVDMPGCGEMISPAGEYLGDETHTPYHWAIGGAIAFPGGLIGIDQREERLGKAVEHFVNCRDDANAHHPVSIIAARMGLGDKALSYLINGVKTNQIYPQGLFSNVTGYPDNIYDLQSVHDLINGHKIRSAAFFQGGMEAISNYATTINEMMLQSNEGKIRVFPAIPSSWQDSTLAFTLLARNGFLVSARMEGGTTLQVGVKSILGNTCKLQNPWPRQPVSVYKITDRGTTKVTTSASDDIISFKTNTDAEYIVCLARNKPINVHAVFDSSPNEFPKILGNRMLGKLSGWDDGFPDRMKTERRRRR